MHESLQPVKISSLAEHSWDFNLVSFTKDKVSDGVFYLSNALEMLGQGVMSVFEIDSVVFLGDFNGFLPLSARLMELAQEVVPSALSVKVFSIIDEI